MGAGNMEKGTLFIYIYCKFIKMSKYDQILIDINILVHVNAVNEQKIQTQTIH